MTYNTILAIFASKADVMPLCMAATNLPGGRDAHIIGSHGEPSQFVVLSAPIDVPDVTAIAALYKQAEARMQEIGDKFAAVCKSEGLSYDWRPFRTPGGDSALPALSSARTADLVIVRQPDRSVETATAADFEALLFDGGRPVLFLPAPGGLDRPASRVLVAWDGSREAARAIQDALPFLKAAEEVEIVVVDAERQKGIEMPLPGIDIAAGLARHGVHASISSVACGGRSTSDVIFEQVRASNAGLLVMGAYTHRRTREWLFGGVTRSVLDHAPVPTLMSR